MADNDELQRHARAASLRKQIDKIKDKKKTESKANGECNTKLTPKQFSTNAAAKQRKEINGP